MRECVHLLLLHSTGPRLLPAVHSYVFLLLQETPFLCVHLEFDKLSSRFQSVWGEKAHTFVYISQQLCPFSCWNINYFLVCVTYLSSFSSFLLIIFLTLLHNYFWSSSKLSSFPSVVFLSCRVLIFGIQNSDCSCRYVWSGRRCVQL